MLRGQKKSELELYVVLWVVLYASAAFGVYWDGHTFMPEGAASVASVESSGYDWGELRNTWKILGMFCLAFMIHNFLIAPLLVYQNKKWGYAICSIILVMAVVGYSAIRFPYAPQFRKHRIEMNADKHVGRPMDRFAGRASDRFADRPFDKPNMRMDKPPRRRRHPDRPTAAAFNILLLLGLNVGAKYYFKLLDDRKRMKELERDNLNQQLQYLKYQINPHFFMNTLNNIHALVDIDPEEAKHTIEVLSKLMRYVLYDADKPMTPLQKELDFLGHYIDLMRIRYTDKVRITVSLPTSVQDIQVPSLLLATFVENAFKHGVSYQKDSFIEVSLRVDEVAREIDFLCYNSKKPEAEEKQAKSSSNKKGGVGLQNAIKRLKLIYGNEYELKIDANADEHRLLLRLPFK